MKIISNCPLCEKHALHVIGENETQTQQCINCGYVTSEKLKLNGMLKQDSEEYKKLTGEMQKWSTVKNDRIWLPTMMILPFGMLYPIGDKNGELQWAFSEMVDIPEEEQKKYPREDGKGFHNKRMDTDNAKIYDLFLEGLSELNQKMKKKSSELKETEIKLPSSTSPIGIEFRSIRFKVALARGGTNTNTPDMIKLALLFKKTLPVQYGFDVMINLSETYKGKSVIDLQAAIETAIATNTLMEFTYRDDSGGTRNYYVTILSAQALEETGLNENARFRLTLSEAI